ncbi:Uncharacterised protein [Mycobacteroides abscessus subsp. abscessus]|nr:Uncharacterised protein [Mycobacteroides abscessus subsp. abscessus]SKV46060.1 Uncharacterised protein [Mycobacteroides abscessus subsp. abscessus]
MRLSIAQVAPAPISAISSGYISPVRRFLNRSVYISWPTTSTE